MFICIDSKNGKHTEGFETLDAAQKKLILLQKEARLQNKICYMTIIEVENADLIEDDEFLIY